MPGCTDAALYDAMVVDGSLPKLKAQQASNGAVASRSADPTAPATPPAWTDGRAWLAQLDAAGDFGKQRLVLRRWVDAAGGRNDGVAIHLPATLPNNGALKGIKYYAGALGLDVRTAPSAPTTTTGPFTRGAS